MDFGSHRTRKRVPLISTAASTSKNNADIRRAASTSTDVYDSSRIDNSDEEVEFLRETNKLPRSSAMIHDQYRKRLKDRNARKQTQEEDIDQLLKDEGLYEEDMTLEIKRQLFAVLQESKETAANEQSFREAAGFHLDGIDNCEESHVKHERPPPSPVLFDDSDTLPANDTLTDPKPEANSSRVADNQASTEMQVTKMRESSDSDGDFLVSSTSRRSSRNKSFHISAPIPLPEAAAGKVASQEKTSSDEEQGFTFSKSAKSFYGMSNVTSLSRPAPANFASSYSTRNTVLMRKATLLTQIPNVWPDPVDTSQDNRLTLPKKRKLSALMYCEKKPYYCMPGREPDVYACTINCLFKRYHKRLRTLQASSVNFIPWNAPITKVHKVRPISASSNMPFSKSAEPVNKFGSVFSSTFIEDNCDDTLPDIERPVPSVAEKDEDMLMEKPYLVQDNNYSLLNLAALADVNKSEESFNPIAPKTLTISRLRRKRPNSRNVEHDEEANNAYDSKNEQITAAQEGTFDSNIVTQETEKSVCRVDKHEDEHEQVFHNVSEEGEACDEDPYPLSVKKESKVHMRKLSRGVNKRKKALSEDEICPDVGMET